MWFNELCKRWMVRSATGRRTRPPASRRPGLRLSLERLEDRTVPANFTAGSVSDLIADINAANLAGGSNTITLAAGKTFTLSAVDNTTDGATGLPVIAAKDNLTIVGNSDIIERSSATGTPAFRLFDVAAGASLTLKSLTLRGGLAFASGGSVYNQGTLSLDGVTVQNNTARGYDGFVSANGFSFPGGSATGGGLYSIGVLTITNSTISNNLAIGGRGVDGGFGCVISCSGNKPSGGGSASGGGVYVGSGTVTISSSTITGNTAQGGDGGGNKSGYGSNGGNGFGGGLYAAGGTVALHNTTVTANVAQGGAGGTGSKHNLDGNPGQGIGGGIYIDNAFASVGLDAFTVGHVKRNHASTSDDNIHGSYDVIL